MILCITIIYIPTTVTIAILEVAIQDNQIPWNILTHYRFRFFPVPVTAMTLG